MGVHTVGPWSLWRLEAVDSSPSPASHCLNNNYSKKKEEGKEGGREGGRKGGRRREGGREGGRKEGRKCGVIVLLSISPCIPCRYGEGVC